MHPQLTFMKHINFCIFALSFWLAGTATAQLAQRELPQTTLSVGIHQILVQVARTQDQHATGLMYRTEMPQQEGMLFEFDTSSRQCFWMKNTLIPLSIAFLDENGTILEIHDMQPKSEKIIKSTFTRIAYALEMQQGWFGKKNIWPGEKVTGLPRPPQS
jgi:uncharacterized membrane protein (UPF0127 family)